jgi:outer membrane lipoprotein carrier protein
MNKIAFFLILAIWPSIAFADSFSCKKEISKTNFQQLVTATEKRYGEVSSMSANFIQDDYWLGLDKRTSSTGSLNFLKPGKMDWSYETPSPQRFVSDGKDVYFYQPDEAQVTITKFEAGFNSELPVSFLLGIGSLSDNFNLNSACDTSAGILLNLEPKVADENLQDFYLLVSKENHSPIGARIIDFGGNQTSFMFQDPKFNNTLEADTFKFDIPMGTDVIDTRDSNK